MVGFIIALIIILILFVFALFMGISKIVAKDKKIETNNNLMLKEIEAKKELYEYKKIIELEKLELLKNKLDKIKEVKKEV